MADLEQEFIRCRDALACAMNWLEPTETPDDNVPIPADKLEWLQERLRVATDIADRLADGEDISLEDILQDEDYLRYATGHADQGLGAISLCEVISRKHGIELTLDQAEALLQRAAEICYSCLTPLNEEGYCDPCEEPEEFNAA